MKVTVELRNGKKVVADIKPVDGKKAKDIAIQSNVLLYARKVPLLKQFGKGVTKCEKYGDHNFDGTLCDYIICTRFENSKIEYKHLLCEKHADELYNYLLESLDPPTLLGDDTPVSNTGVNP